MIEYYKYDTEKYPFIGLFKELFGREDLQKLHENSFKEYNFFTEPGNDSDTEFHKIFYDRMRSGWPQFIEAYQLFVKDFVAPKIGASDKIIYQKWPSFRVQLPDNVAVGGWHRDSDYNHPKGEMNFIIAITDMYESNPTIAESEPGKMDFRQLELSPGDAVKFDGNRCTHGNLPNRTGVTRISFDFRVMLPKDYDQNHELESLSKGNKFLIGHYYDIMEL